MDSLSLLSPSLSFTEEKNHHDGSGSSGVFFDSSLLKKQANIPKQFIWPRAERPGTLQVLRTPVVDLEGFFKSDEASIQHSVRLIGEACSAHGVFQVINHGVSAALCQDTFQFIDHFFKLPSEVKLRARRRPGSTWGYAGAHADRFTSRLPWKETLSFGYGDGESERVAEYFASVLGQDFERMGYDHTFACVAANYKHIACCNEHAVICSIRLVYQKYSEDMFELGLAIMELLGMSSGVGGAYREFFEDGSCIMRCNYYPPCQEPELVLGTGPHCDPTALTILQQDEVAGLEVFAEGKWQSVLPVRGAMVVSIGDTFMVHNIQIEPLI